MTTSTLKGNCVTYFMCMFCNDTALSYYPAELHFVLTGTDNWKGNLHVGMIMCYTCTRDPSNYDAMRYYVDNDVDISYVKSTWIYKKVKDKYQVKPPIITMDDGAGLLDIDKFIDGLTDKCVLYSIICTSEGMTRTSPRASFYGNLVLE